MDWGNTRQRRNSILHVHFSPDGEHLAASGFGHSAVYAWRTNPDIPIASFTVEEPKLEDYRKEGADYDRHFPISFSPSGNLLAYVSSPDTVTLSDINTGEGHCSPHWTHCHRCIPSSVPLAGSTSLERTLVPLFRYGIFRTKPL